MINKNLQCRKPNLFIIGAPKCGTTSLHYYLSQHPKIFMSSIKEPHFFSNDLEVEGNITDEKKYYSLFSEVNNEKIIGESSVWYLYSKSALLNIKKYVPSAKIIIMLRNPIDMFFSLYSQRVRAIYSQKGIGYETRSIIEILEDEEKMKKPAFDKYIPCISYTEALTTSKYIEQYLSFFGDNVHIIIFDDFKDNVEFVYQNLLEFLGVNSDSRPDFTVRNVNRKVKNRALLYFFEGKTPFPFSFFKKKLSVSARKRLGKLISPFYLDYDSHRYQELKKNKLLVEKLKKKFFPETERLSQLLNRDLVSLWEMEN